MTSTIDTSDPADDLDTRRGTTTEGAEPVRGVGAVGLRRKPVTRSVRGRRTVVVPAERLSPADLAGRIPFVVVMLLLIGTGVGGTLLLSAQTTQDTYNLKNARDANVQLVERMEALQASNERARSAEVLAQRAEKLGMVGVASAPILTRGSDGVIEVVGEPGSGSVRTVDVARPGRIRRTARAGAPGQDPSRGRPRPLSATRRSSGPRRAAGADGPTRRPGPGRGPRTPGSRTRPGR